MTKGKTLCFLILFFITGACLPYFYDRMKLQLLHSDACSATIVVFHGDARADLTLDFMYTPHEKKGVVSVSGTYAQGVHQQGNIRRDISYSWTDNKDIYHLKSSVIHKFANVESLPDEIIAQMLPDFYVYPQKQITYSIHNLGNDGFVFSIGKRPIFYCTRSLR
ncbi:FidL-like membrane protein [Kosakonia sp. BK9b]|uniref:hypothetical protein n=1 Tax=Kosakonia sp. TaxID=1916651 RepID=UPI00289B8B10|nr:hypothetical protein [Kosakonia sp.]